MMFHLSFSGDINGPGFAQRLQGLWSKEQLTQQLGSMTVEDLTTLLNDFPQAAASVLEAATAEPTVVSHGRHPLPARVSFACREWKLKFQMPRLCFYTPEVLWSFNDTCRMAPSWHSCLTNIRDKPMHDARIQVCHIADIISPSFFSGVLDARTTHQQALFLFNCTPVRGAVWFTFWNGSMWVDIVQTMISTWGLCLLVVETLMAHEASVEYIGTFSASFLYIVCLSISACLFVCFSISFVSATLTFQPFSQFVFVTCSFLPRTDQSFVALQPSLADGKGIVADWIVAKGRVFGVGISCPCLINRQEYLCNGSLLFLSSFFL